MHSFLPQREVRSLNMTLNFPCCSRCHTLSLFGTQTFLLFRRAGSKQSRNLCIRGAERWMWCGGTKYTLQPSLGTVAAMRLNPPFRRKALKPGMVAHCEFKPRTLMLYHNILSQKKGRVHLLGESPHDLRLYPTWRQFYNHPGDKLPTQAPLGDETHPNHSTRNITHLNVIFLHWYLPQQAAECMDRFLAALGAWYHHIPGLQPIDETKRHLQNIHSQKSRSS